MNGWATRKRSGATMSRCRSVGIRPEVLEAITTSAGRVAADLRQHALLQLELLGDVLLDEIRLRAPSRRRSVVKVSLPLGGSGANVSARERRLGVVDGTAYPGLHLRLDVGRDHVDAEMQRARGPARRR